MEKFAVEKILSSINETFSQNETQFTADSYIYTKSEIECRNREISDLERITPNIEKSIPNVIKINKDKPSASIKSQNYIINFKKVINDIGNGTLKTFGGYNLGKFIGQSVSKYSSFLGYYSSNAFLLLGVLYLLYLICQNNVIEIDEKQSLMLLVLWQNKDSDTHWINIDFAYNKVNEYLSENELSNIPKGEFVNYLRKLDAILCIEYIEQHNLIWLKEEITIQKV